jgi:hypothetical protein
VRLTSADDGSWNFTSPLNLKPRLGVRGCNLTQARGPGATLKSASPQCVPDRAPSLCACVVAFPSTAHLTPTSPLPTRSDGGCAGLEHGLLGSGVFEREPLLVCELWRVDWVSVLRNRRCVVRAARASVALFIHGCALTSVPTRSGAPPLRPPVSFLAPRSGVFSSRALRFSARP